MFGNKKKLEDDIDFLHDNNVSSYKYYYIVFIVFLFSVFYFYDSLHRLIHMGRYSKYEKIIGVPFITYKEYVLFEENDFNDLDKIDIITDFIYRNKDYDFDFDFLEPYFNKIVYKSVMHNINPLFLDSYKKNSSVTHSKKLTPNGTFYGSYQSFSCIDDDCVLVFESYSNSFIKEYSVSVSSEYQDIGFSLSPSDSVFGYCLYHENGKYSNCTLAKGVITF